MHLAGPVPPPNLETPSPHRCVLLWVAVSKTRYQVSVPLIQSWRLEGPSLSPAGLAPFLTSPYPFLGSGFTLETLREVHGLHKLFSNIKGIQATQLLLPEELPPDR